jgi:hypothetical protein
LQRVQLDKKIFIIITNISTASPLYECGDFIAISTEILLTVSEERSEERADKHCVSGGIFCHRHYFYGNLQGNLYEKLIPDAMPVIRPFLCCVSEVIFYHLSSFTKEN